MNWDKDFYKGKEVIDKYLKEVVNIDTDYIENIKESIIYSLFTGGKRIRPILGLKSYELFADSQEYNEILPFISAIELIHTYSLVHDDLPSMDNDDYRRGKPTNHKKFGEAMAILAGDGLLNLASEILLDFISESILNGSFHEKYIYAMREIFKYSGINGMIGGQVIDLHADPKNIEKNELLTMYKLKTSGLIEASLVAGAIVGNASKEEISSIRKYGYYLGMAYQIRDDLLDMEEDKAIDKLTYISFFGKEKGEEDLEVFSKKAIEILEKFSNRDISFLKEMTNRLIHREI